MHIQLECFIQYQVPTIGVGPGCGRCVMGKAYFKGRDIAISRQCISSWWKTSILAEKPNKLIYPKSLMPNSANKLLGSLHANVSERFTCTLVWNMITYTANMTTRTATTTNKSLFTLSLSTTSDFYNWPQTPNAIPRETNKYVTYSSFELQSRIHVLTNFEDNPLQCSWQLGFKLSPACNPKRLPPV